MAAVRRSALLIAALLALCLIHESTGVRRGDEDADDEGDAVEAKSEDATMESTPEPAAVEPEVSASSTQSDAGEGASSDVDDEAASSEGKPPPEDDSLPPHFVEGSIACFLAMFAVTFFMGRSTNEKIAQEWVKLILSDESSSGLRRNFWYLGDNSDKAEKVLQKDSMSHFMVHATGRRHCKWLLATLDLTKRHDLFSVVFNQLFVKPSQSADRVRFTAPLTNVGKFCVAICPKSEVKTQRADHADIAKFTEGADFKRIGKDFSVLTDCEEVVPEILRGEETMKCIEKLKPYLRCIHISDKSSVDPRYPAMLRVEFTLPSLKDLKNNGPGATAAKDMARLAIHLIDVCAKATNWQAKQSGVAVKVEQRRAERSKSKRKHEIQQENAARRKDLKLAQEKAKMEKMDPEELRRYEEKKYKQDMKARMKKQGKAKMMRM